MAGYPNTKELGQEITEAQTNTERSHLWMNCIYAIVFLSLGGDFLPLIMCLQSAEPDSDLSMKSMKLISWNKYTFCGTLILKGCCKLHCGSMMFDIVASQQMQDWRF